MRVDSESLLAFAAAAAIGGLGYIAASADLRARIGGSFPTVRGPAHSETAVVAEVIDGDTLTLTDGRMVRLLGIDAPETVNPRMVGAQPFGPQASSRLAELVAGREVALERDVSDADHYGRLLRHVWVGSELVSVVLVREGLAWAGSMPPDVMHSALLEAAEAEARGARRGLWGVERPTPLPIFQGR